MMKYWFLLLILQSCYTKQIKNFDEIQIYTSTDTSTIELFIKSDTIIIFQVIGSDGFYPPFEKIEYRLATNYLKNELSFHAIYEELKVVLNDTFIQKAETIYDGGSPSSIAFLLRDSMIKSCSFYEMEANCKELVNIKNKYLEYVKSHEWNTYNTNKLLRVSKILNMDSVKISKIKPYIYKGKIVNFINDSELKTIKDSSNLNTLVNKIIHLPIMPNLKFLDMDTFLPNYRLDFYKGRLIEFRLQTDLHLMPFDFYQTLIVDSTFIDMVF